MQCFRVDFCRRVNRFAGGQLGWLDREELHVIAETAQEAIRTVEQIYVGTVTDDGECFAVDVIEVACELDVAAWPGRDLRETRIDVATSPEDPVRDDTRTADALRSVREAGL